MAPGVSGEADLELDPDEGDVGRPELDFDFLIFGLLDVPSAVISSRISDICSSPATVVLTVLEVDAAPSSPVFVLNRTISIWKYEDVVINNYLTV